MGAMDIGEVARRSGVSPSALRYYEQIGLIRSVGRNGLRRQFDPGVLLKLSLIELGKVAGFSLEEIAGMFGGDGTLGIPRADLHAKADELGRQIAGLRVLRNAVRHVADCPAPSHLACPNFQRLLRSVSPKRGDARAPRAAPDGRHLTQGARKQARKRKV
ncbi:helix-turn-helix domain-containing protein [Pseudoxanthomonas wuyuanensis]|uniref:DNA-binding transcriptional regulator, MerR family n=1 Tax=Pseudoxanthomonas wuyuanensis TaxID=1073196 RepID=A0A286D2H8_9GAMM|nr:helix-turn-helix domain-containing protein [Pseudoxanthomonas wuyuanensis]KAF1723111.1 MerR family transcriptional regulator [Pseudoxanthomonas wuyuanensis]SOD52861.1 DNA-binding transcriptional regulator, MerR family [Pseudoxanthomonas wuyuanensis]